MTDSRFYDVFRVDPDTSRPIVVRMKPCDWSTAIGDYRRYQADDHTVSLFEVTESGEKIREITPLRRTSQFGIGWTVSTPHTDSAVICEIGTEFVTCMWGDNNRRKYEPNQLLVKQMSA